MTLVDTNVLLDVLTDDPVWADWSIRQLDAADIRGPLLINDIVYAELSVGFDAIEVLDGAVEALGASISAIPLSALFLAGKVFQGYRASGGLRAGVPTAFFIGAHAAVSGWPLLTRDPRRYRTYFPALELIAPETSG